MQFINKSLAIKESTKGIYRRAIINLELNNLEESEADLKKALAMDSSLKFEVDIQLKKI